MAVRTGLRFIKIQAWVSPALLQWVDTFAQEHSISRAALVRRALVEYLNGQTRHTFATYEWSAPAADTSTET